MCVRPSPHRRPNWMPITTDDDRTLNRCLHQRDFGKSYATDSGGTACVTGRPLTGSQRGARCLRGSESSGAPRRSWERQAGGDQRGRARFREAASAVPFRCWRHAMFQACSIPRASDRGLRRVTNRQHERFHAYRELTVNLEWPVRSLPSGVSDRHLRWFPQGPLGEDARRSQPPTRRRRVHRRERE
jgi:hypothetical protein